MRKVKWSIRDDGNSTWGKHYHGDYACESIELARRANIGVVHAAPGTYSKLSIDADGRLHYRFTLPRWLNAIGVWILKRKASQTGSAEHP